MQEPYRSFHTFLKEKFDYPKIRKIPVNAGFDCPNKNGTVSAAGCIFCDVYGAGPIDGPGAVSLAAAPGTGCLQAEASITAQIELFIKDNPDSKFLAYYQAHSNTYAPVAELKKRYEIIFRYEDIVGLFIGTRPDAIAGDVYPLLERVAQRTYLSVELGLQSIHEKSLLFLNRGHSYGQFLETFGKLKERGIDVVVHMIVGIPGENLDDMLATVKEMNRLQPAGVKLHVLHVLKNTPLYEEYKKGKIHLLEKEEYIEIIIALLEHLDPDIVIHRLTGEREREIFEAPLWTLKKAPVIQEIRRVMWQRGTYQGRCYPDCH